MASKLLSVIKMQKQTTSNGVKTTNETENQKLHARFLINRTDKIVQKAVASVSNLNLEKEREITILISKIKLFGNDLQILLHHLQSLAIKTNENGQSAQQLAKFAKNIANFADTVETPLNEDLNSAKNDFISVLLSLTPEAHLLVEFIDDESNDAYYDLVDIIDDITFAVKKVYYRNLFETKTIEELKVFEHKLINDYLKEMDESTKDNDVNMPNFIKQTQNCVRRVLIGVKMVVDEVNSFEEETKIELLNMTQNMRESLTRMDEILLSKQKQSFIKEQSEACAKVCCYAMVDLINRFDPNNQDPKIAVNLRNLMLNILVHQKALAEQLSDGTAYFNENACYIV